MPPVIPKYQREQLRVPDAIAKQGGAADKAAAIGQQGIGQAYSRVGQAYSQSASQESQAMNMEIGNLKNRLSEFNTMLENTTSQIAQQYAKREGFKDIAKRRQEILELQNKYHKDPAKMHEEIAKVTTATMQDDFSLYGRVYSSVVNASYANQVEEDARNSAYYAQVNSNGDPRLFQQMYKGYKDQFTEGAPNEIGQVVADKAFEKHGASTFRAMHSANSTKSAALQKEKNKTRLSALGDLIDNYSSKGDFTMVKALQGELAGVTAGMVASGTMDATYAEWLNTESMTKAQSNEYIRNGLITAGKGLGFDYIASLKKDKNFAALPIDAQQEVLSSTEKAIKTIRENDYKEEQYANTERKVIQENNLTAHLVEIGETGKELTGSELDALKASGELSAAGAKEIVEYQNKTTIEEVFTGFSDGAVLVNMTTQQILNLDDISYTDKQTLIKQRESALNNKLYDWTTSKLGKRAFDYLADDYDVPKDSVAMILAGIKKEKTPAQKAYEKDKRDITQKVEANYAYADQPKGAMIEYEKLKAVREAEKAATTANTAEENLQGLVTKYEELSEDSGGIFSSQKTPLELAKEDRDKKDGVEGKITNTTYENIKARLEGKTKPMPKHQSPTKLKEPEAKVNLPKVHSYAHDARTEEWGHTPVITGKNVDIARVRANIKKSAYPIMNKFGLTIKDGFRSTVGGGATGSQHLHGNALDVEGWSKKTIPEKQEILREFKAAGFNGFGVGANTLHVDKRPTPGSWSYYGTNSATGKGGKMPAWAAEVIGG